jgi:ELWxxDGT repeat protein
MTTEPLILFTATDANGKCGLFTSNGASAGTSEVKVVSSSSGARSEVAGVLNGKVLLRVYNEDNSSDSSLWVTDGTASGTLRLFSGAMETHAGVVYNNKLLFTATDAQNNWGLWTTDGTSAGASEILSFAASSYRSATFAGVLNGKQVVEIRGAYDASGKETDGLWLTDGTATGTVKIVSFPSYSYLPSYKWLDVEGVYNNKVLFTAPDSAGNFGLWTSGGDSSSATEIKVLDSTVSDTNFARDVGSLNGKKVIEVFSSSPAEVRTGSLWLTDGTAANTTQIKSFTSQIYGDVEVAGEYNNRLLFAATDDKGKYGLWTSDGAAGASEFKVLTPAGYNDGSWVGALNGKQVLQVVSSGASGETQSLWITDGTAAGTVQLAAFNISGRNPDLVVGGIYNNKLMFSTTDDKGNHSLWASDGSPSGTTEIKVFPSANSGRISFDGTLNGKAVLKVSSSGTDAGTASLWLTDGTAAGTTQATGLNGLMNSYTCIDGVYQLAKAVGAVSLRIAEISATASSTYLKAGETVSIALTTSGAVTVTGSPTLTLNDGGVATYDSAHSTATRLVFTYTVKVGQNTSALALSKLNLPSGASIKDASGAALAALPSDTGLRLHVDTVAPSIKSVAATNSSEPLKAGKTISIVLMTSEPVTVKGSPTLSLNDGGVATYNAKSSTATKLVFTYTVKAGETTSALTATKLDLPSGVSITDLAGNALTTALPSSAALGLQVDAIAPTTGGVAAAASATPLNAGKTISISITTSEPVTVKGVPTLTLNDGGVATYDAAHSTARKLVFTYTVLAGHNTTTLRATKLNLRAGASITDQAGNALVVKLPVGSPGPVIDTAAPTVAGVASSPSSGGAISTGGVVTITLKMSEPVTVADAPVLLLNDGGTASYDAKNSTATSLVFAYEAPSNQGAKSLSVVGIQMASPTSILDAAGNVADLAKSGAVLGVKVNAISTGPAAITISGTSEAEIFGASSQNVTFASGAAGALKLDAATAYTGKISGLTKSDMLDLSNLAYGSKMTVGYTGTSAGGTLSVSNGAQTAKIALIGNYASSSFTAACLASDGHGGTTVTPPNPLTLTAKAV